jgi:predicted phosphodiesterase
MRAIISDIHANIEALETVLKDIQTRNNISEIICLGDIVGYGPNPQECLDIIKDFKLVIMGNHDEAVFKTALLFRDKPREAIDWTRQILKPHWLSPPLVKKRWQFIESLPLTHQENNILYVHGSPRNPTVEYILKSDTDITRHDNRDKLDDIFNMIPQICFIGHTHEPGIINQDYKFLTPTEINNTYSIKRNEKIIVNVGSVGQPRDGDNRACYITFDENSINYHRVTYPYQITQEKIEKIPALDRHFAERLAKGE